MKMSNNYYSQIILGNRTGRITSKTPMMKDVEKPFDHHRQKASELFGVPIDKVTNRQRHIAKRYFYMESYGASPDKLKRFLENELNQQK